jgi:hypothetical protein
MEISQTLSVWSRDVSECVLKGQWNCGNGIFPPSFQDGFSFLPRYQTLRVWLISGCAFGTNKGDAQTQTQHRTIPQILCLVAAAKIMRPGRGATPDISQRRKSLEIVENKMCPEGTMDFDAPGADHLTPLAFLDRPIFRIQFASPVWIIFS